MRLAILPLTIVLLTGCVTTQAQLSSEYDSCNGLLGYNDKCISIIDAKKIRKQNLVNEQQEIINALDERDSQLFKSYRPSVVNSQLTDKEAATLMICAYKRLNSHADKLFSQVLKSKTNLSKEDYEQYLDSIEREEKKLIWQLSSKTYAWEAYCDHYIPEIQYKLDPTFRAKQDHDNAEKIEVEKKIFLERKAIVFDGDVILSFNGLVIKNVSTGILYSSNNYKKCDSIIRFGLNQFSGCGVNRFSFPDIADLNVPPHKI